MDKAKFQMNLKKNWDFIIFGFTGSILLILSEFFSWSSDYTLLDRFEIATSVAIEDSFLYLFPFLSGIICLAASIIVIYDFKLRIKSVIITSIGIGFLLIFFIEFISKEVDYILNIGVGFYLFLVGFLLIIINIINILLTKEEESE
ncbi:MAG: hypothetical protein ACFFA6_12185 [Promethearchaeota archaeon]